MDYRTFPPPDDLAPFIRCFWTLDAPADPDAPRQRIVPDGCMEVIFHHGDRYRQFRSDGSSVVQPRCFVFGQITEPLEIAPTGRTGMFSVRFVPGGFLPFTSRPLSVLADRATELDDIFGPPGHELARRILASPSTAERMEVVSAWLRGILTQQATADHVVSAAVQVLTDAQGSVTVSELADSVQVHRRRLERRFSDHIGLSPKQLARIVRLQGAVARLANGDFDRLTDLAHDAGYFDQAHFIREFKEFTGETPGAFFSGNLLLSSLFSGSS